MFQKMDLFLSSDGMLGGMYSEGPAGRVLFSIYGSQDPPFFTWQQ